MMTSSGTSLPASMNCLASRPMGVPFFMGVALETTKSMEAQMLMRHYKGFLATSTGLNCMVE